MVHVGKVVIRNLYEQQSFSMLKPLKYQHRERYSVKGSGNFCLSHGSSLVLFLGFEVQIVDRWNI